MSKWDDLAAYYEERYQIAAAWSVRPEDKIFLGDKDGRKCRFCGRAKPEVSFRKEAHALPESIGNESLFTYYECDTCNQAFGEGCENDFGKLVAADAHDGPYTWQERNSPDQAGSGRCLAGRGTPDWPQSQRR